MTMTAASAAYFERVAGEWDTLRAGYFGEDVRESALLAAYLRPEMTVADVGSGTGFMAAGLAPRVAKVIALDGSAAMLDEARRNLAAYDSVVYQATDGHVLPLPDASVDAVFANMYLHHCSDPLAAIREMVRVLKPGGRLLIGDMDRHEHAWLREEMADEWPGFDRRQVAGWLREAGLVNTIVDCTGQSCCAQSNNPEITDAAGRTAQISIFLARGTRRVPGVREAVQADYGAHAVAGSCCGSAEPVAASSSCCCAPTTAEIKLEADLTGTGDLRFGALGYSANDLADVPAAAAALSLGCGNPGAMASLRPGEVVLDIGSGGGIDAFYAARRVGPTGRVIGLDMTPAMIERARRTASETGLPNVEFRLGQAEAMPVEDGTVDVILSNCVINLCEDKGRVFEEAYRVLREGGRLAISDMVTDGPLPMSVRGNVAQWAGCLNGALPEREYLDLVTAAGFHDVVGTRSGMGGMIEGVGVFSLGVSARKGGTAAVSGDDRRP